MSPTSRCPARLLGALLLLALPAAASGQVASEALAITHVEVITMADGRRLPDATVVVRGGRIAAVGPAASIPVPAGARQIDGRGRYLIPGLADMHGHLFADDWVADSVAPYELGVYLAHGVTTLRLQIGTPQHLVLRRQVQAGELAGPRLWVSSPMLSGDSARNTLLARTPDQGRAAVRTAHQAGYDLVKLTTNITPDVYDAIVAEARGLGIRVTGHVDPRVGVARALAAGQQIEHFDNYMESVLADSAPSRVSVSDVGAYRVANWNSLLHVDMRKVEALAGATARAGVYVTPTWGFFQSWFARAITIEDVRARPDFALVPPAMRAPYERAFARYWANPPSEELRARYIAIRNRMIRALADSGGRIMAGSDGPGGLQVYGWMMHRELEALVAAGLSPAEALHAATVAPAEYLGVVAEQGTIEVGKRADLVLLARDPLADIRNTTAIVGVGSGGRWFTERDLQGMVEAARLRLNPPVPGGP